MDSLFALVFITIFSIHCHAITVRDDDDSIYEDIPKRYSDSDIDKSEVEYKQQDYYKPLRRADVASYQYTEESNQESEYPQPQSDRNAGNYPFTQRGQAQQIARRRTVNIKKPYVEQYLKEVTPTTKTTYNQRPRNYLRLSEQANQKAIKQAEDLQGDILKQSSAQYVLQSDLRQKQPQVQYVISPSKQAQIQQKQQPPQTAALTAFQNALLAHQKVLETEGQDETSRSSIYVTHSIPKKPVRKIVKPTAGDEDEEQYTQLQQYEIQQKQPNLYERREPEQVNYQAKVRYSSEDASFQASTEAPNYQREKELKQLRQQLQDIIQYQQVSTEQPVYQEEKLVQQQPQQLAAYQQLLSNRQAKITRPSKTQISPTSNYQRPELLVDYRTPSKTAELPSIQYQQPIYAKKGPKYLPEPKSSSYQSAALEETEDKFKQIVNVPGQHPEPLITYEAAIAKLQAEKLLEASQQERQRPQVVYQQQEQSAPNVGFTLQYPAEREDGTSSDSDYVRIGQVNKYRTSASPSPTIYRQPQENANVRYYRNSGRPVISYAHYQ